MSDMVFTMAFWKLLTPLSSSSVIGLYTCVRAPERYERLGIVLPLCSCLRRVNSLRFRGSGKGVNGQDTSGSSSAESVSYSDPYSDPDTSSAGMSDFRRRLPPPGPWLPASEDCTAAIGMGAVSER